jgi:hypothetical protein
MAYDKFTWPEISGFNSEYMGRGFVKYILAGPNNIAQTGSAVTFPFQIGAPHRLALVELELTNSSSTPDTAGFTVVVKRLNYAGVAVPIASSNGSQLQDSFLAAFGDSYSSVGATNYQLVTTGANLDKVYAKLIVEYLGWERLEINDTGQSIIAQSPAGSAQFTP